MSRPPGWERAACSDTRPAYGSYCPSTLEDRKPTSAPISAAAAVGAIPRPAASNVAGSLLRSLSKTGCRSTENVCVLALDHPARSTTSTVESRRFSAASSPVMVCTWCTDSCAK